MTIYYFLSTSGEGLTLLYTLVPYSMLCEIDVLTKRVQVSLDSARHLS